MKTFVAVLVSFLLSFGCHAADEVYPLRDAKDGEGRPSWWWDAFNQPVVIVRGSLREIQKDRPDLSIQGTYDAWSKLTAPSLANEPTEKGFYLLLTRLKTSEVIYVDKTLLHSNAEINWLLDGKRTEMDCILRAEVKQIGEPDEEGHYRFTYALTFNKFIDHPISSGKEFILIFHYVNLYPIQGLCLTSWASVDEIDQIRKIAQYRKQH